MWPAATPAVFLLILRQKRPEPSDDSHLRPPSRGFCVQRCLYSDFSLKSIRIP